MSFWKSKLITFLVFIRFDRLASSQMFVNGLLFIVTSDKRDLDHVASKSCSILLSDVPVVNQTHLQSETV